MLHFVKSKRTEELSTENVSEKRKHPVCPLTSYSSAGNEQTVTRVECKKKSQRLGFDSKINALDKFQWEIEAKKFFLLMSISYPAYPRNLLLCHCTAFHFTSNNAWCCYTDFKIKLSLWTNYKKMVRVKVSIQFSIKIHIKSSFKLFWNFSLDLVSN